MIILLPLVIIILVIVLIDQLYYPPKEPTQPPIQGQQHTIKQDINATQNYLDKYIKK